MDTLYQFLYNDMTEESSWATMSLHRTKEGAEKAMNEHKQAALKEWKESYSENEPYPFGRFQDWRVSVIHVQD